MSNEHHYDLILFIIGPDNAFYYQSIFDFLIKKSNNVVIIGDGIKNIADNDRGEFFEVISVIQNFNASNVLIYIHAHGIKSEEEYYVDFGYPLKVKKLFYSLADKFDKPLDILFFPCYGKSALPYINYLPDNSKVIIFSDENKSTYILNSLSSIEAMDRLNDFNIDIFYDNYLSYMTQLESPLLIKLPNVMFDPIKLVHEVLNISISPYFKEYINNHFTKNICYNSSSCFDRVNRIINKVEDALSIDEFLVEGCKYIDLLSKIKLWQSEILYNESDYYCSKKVLTVKNKIDNYLFYHEIPLSVDLSYSFWNKPSIIPYAFSDLNDQLLFKALKLSFFNQNNNFEPPEYLEAGILFGIIKDIYFS